MSRKYTVEQIAEVAHEADRAYCRMIGAGVHQRWADAADWQQQNALKRVADQLDEGSNFIKQTMSERELLFATIVWGLSQSMCVPEAVTAADQNLQPVENEPTTADQATGQAEPTTDGQETGQAQPEAPTVNDQPLPVVATLPEADPAPEPAQETATPAADQTPEAPETTATE